ncbi:DNA-directed RNA polymerase II subunit RPB1-like [Tachysurus vachellii]|uniref:DNA-directed RNA polymerase II subunit RPB1-like n=1 Tax=Tachysurus vachellii TaxID=175792 RepID=UPI00296B03FF|nr:DNA-directed RNA polymerase II subunit RPB1-like [Tachysurus vachellii]
MPVQYASNILVGEIETFGRAASTSSLRTTRIIIMPHYPDSEKQLCSPELPEHPYLLSHIVRNPPARTSSSQTPLATLMDQRTQTDGCPHAEPCCPELGTPVSPPRPSSPPLACIRPFSPALASPSSGSETGLPVYISPSPSPQPCSPDYTPTSPRPDSTGPYYFF